MEGGEDNHSAIRERDAQKYKLTQINLFRESWGKITFRAWAWNKARPRFALTRSERYSNSSVRSVVLYRRREKEMRYEAGNCLLEDTQGRYSHWKDEGYSFAYDKNYLTIPKTQGISLTMPLREGPFLSNTFHPFFDGLICGMWIRKHSTNGMLLEKNQYK